PISHWNASLARLAMGDYERGCAEYEWRWQNWSLKLPRHSIDKPLWLGQEGIEGRTIVLHPEQGLGDAIQFVRYAPLIAARGAQVVIACHALLMDLFRTVSGVRTVIDPEGPRPDFDYHIPMMSLPRAFRTGLDSVPAQVPYLSAAPSRIEAWRRRLASHAARTKVGLVWAGNPQHRRDRARSCPIERLAPVVESTQCAFFSLQKGAAAADVVKLDASG